MQIGKGHWEYLPVSLLPILYKRFGLRSHYHSFLACQTRKMFRLAVLVTQTQSQQMIYQWKMQPILSKSDITFLSLSSAVRPLLLLRLRPRPTPTTAMAMALVATLDTATLA